MKKAAVLVGLLAVGACGGKDDSAATPPPVSSPAPTPPAATAPAPTTTPSATSAPSTTEPVATSEPASSASPSTAAPATTEPATTSPVTTSGPTSGVAVVYAAGDGEFPWLPVGWWDGSAWQSVDWPDADDVIPAASFDAVSVSSQWLADSPQRGRTDFEPRDYECIDSPGPASIVLDPGLPDVDQWYGYRALAVTADWDIQPRPVRAVGLDVPEYQQLGESLVPASVEIDPTRGDVVQVVRADLDGDGVEEVLFVFEHFAAADTGLATPGDFSILVARYPRPDGTVVDDVLVEHLVQSPVEYPTLDRSRVAAIADFNGDGVMEVAIGTAHWEGASMAVHELRDGALHEVMSSGCGV